MYSILDARSWEKVGILLSDLSISTTDPDLRNLNRAIEKQDYIEVLNHSKVSDNRVFDFPARFSKGTPGYLYALQVFLLHEGFYLKIPKE